jgi:hypothetical protein
MEREAANLEKKLAALPTIKIFAVCEEIFGLEVLIWIGSFKWNHKGHKVCRFFANFVSFVLQAFEFSRAEKILGDKRKGSCLIPGVVPGSTTEEF